jgi:multimeric flavodoxin WrbA
MKLLGFSCGRKVGNTEILIKEALMGAEELGVEVEILRMLDLDIRPCKFCKNCLARQDGPEACVIKDDAAFLYNTFMDCDGIILGAPVYALTPPGYLKMMEDRVLGPNVDLAGMRARKKSGGINPFTGGKVFVDDRAFKPRVGALISDGGASSPHWLSFGLALLYTFTFPPNVVVIDHLQVFKAQPAPHVGMVVLNDKALARARKLGCNVAAAMGKPINKVKWMGDSPGICPVCHCNLLTVTNKNPVECPVCGISGTLKIENGKISVAFSEKEQEHSRLTETGKLDHQIEIQNVMKEQAPRAAEVPLKVKKYKSYLTPLKPPSKLKKSAVKD